MSNAETMQNCAQMDNMKCRTKIRRKNKNKNRAADWKRQGENGIEKSNSKCLFRRYIERIWTNRVTNDEFTGEKKKM